MVPKSAPTLEARLTQRTVLKNTFEESRSDGALGAAPTPRSRATPPPPLTARTRPARPPGAARVFRQEVRKLESLEHARKVLSETLLYPAEARAQGLEGETVLLLVLGEQGEIQRVDVARSSGHAILDEAAVAAAARLGRLPAASRQLLLRVPFQLY